jgi:uncharacterized membrane protein
MSTVRSVARWLLGAFMLFAGTAHLVSSHAFLAVVPTWLPLRIPIVVVSGVVELGFGLALVVTSGRRLRQVGWALAAFFVLVFPGNVYQAVAGTYAFGLDTPARRWGRLVFQIPLIVWALWSTEAWPLRRHEITPIADVSSSDG